MRRSQRQVSLRQFFTPHYGDTQTTAEKGKYNKLNTSPTETIDILEEESPGDSKKCRPFLVSENRATSAEVVDTVESKPGLSEQASSTPGPKKRQTKKRTVSKLAVGVADASGSSTRPKRISIGTPQYKEVNETSVEDHDIKKQHHTSKKQKLDNSVKIDDSECNMSDAENQNIPSSSQANVPKKKKATKPRAPRQPAGQNKGAKRVPAKRKTKLEKITDQLKAIGIEKSQDTGNCARAAIYKGFIKLTGNVSDLDQVVMSGNLPECGHHCSVTLRSLLEQPDYAGMDYEDGQQEATVFCDQNTEANEYDGCDVGRTYVTHMCSGKPEFDSGKFHNHCVTCKNFGKCIGDYREAHCERCGKHYFAGSGGSFRCPCRERYRGFGGEDYSSGDSSGGDDCSIM